METTKYGSDVPRLHAHFHVDVLRVELQHVVEHLADLLVLRVDPHQLHQQEKQRQTRRLRQRRVALRHDSTHLFGLRNHAVAVAQQQIEQSVAHVASLVLQHRFDHPEQRLALRRVI